MSEEKTALWRKTRLGRLATKLVNGGTPPTNVECFWNGRIPWVTGADFTSSGLGEFRRFVSEEAVSKTATNVIEQGQLLIVTRTGVGKLAIAPCDIAISQDITGFYVDEGQASPAFLYHRMRRGVEDLKKLNQGTSINGIVRTDLINYPVELPPIPQQRRIAEILSTVDETIEQTEALIAKYQQIKAGLMHDLFTLGVTPDGRLRPTCAQAPHLYKESPLGWIPKEWEVKALNSAVDFWDGQRVPLKEEDRFKMPGNIPYYGASGIIDYIDRWLFDDELILLGEDGENIVSRNLPLAFKVTGKCWVNNHAHVLKPRSGQDIDYWTEYLDWRDYSQMASGSAQPKITQGHLSRLTVSVPQEQEQKLVSERLKSLTNRLSFEDIHLQKLRRQKHGLMHDLLTGRVRVKVAELATTSQP